MHCFFVFFWFIQIEMPILNYLKVENIIKKR